MVSSNCKKMNYQKDLLILDGDCGLCNRIATFMDKRLSLNSSISFLARESIEAKKIIKTFSKSDQMVDTVFLRKNKIFYIRSAAAIRCLLYLKWYWKIFFPILWIIPLPLRDLIYKVIATYRHKFFEKPKVCTFKVD